MMRYVDHLMFIPPGCCRTRRVGRLFSGGKCGGVHVRGHYQEPE
jgi:hypothetical protein